MSPSGGETMVVDHPMTWSPENKAPVSIRANARWLEVCPGVATASSVHPVPAIRSSSPNTRSGT